MISPCLGLKLRCVRLAQINERSRAVSALLLLSRNLQAPETGPYARARVERGQLGIGPNEQFDKAMETSVERNLQGIGSQIIWYTERRPRGNPILDIK